MEKNRDNDKFKWSIKAMNKQNIRDEKKRAAGSVSHKRYSDQMPYINNQLKNSKKRAASSQMALRKHVKVNQAILSKYTSQRSTSVQPSFGQTVSHS